MPICPHRPSLRCIGVKAQALCSPCRTVCREKRITGYERPFDNFNFEVAADTDNEGLYGSYEYVAAQVFRVSTTAASLGTTNQWWISSHVAFQSTLLGGVGYGGGGVLHGSGVTTAGPLGVGQREYHYGLTPQTLINARLLLGDRVSLDT